MAGGKIFLITEYPLGDKYKSGDGRSLELVEEAWKQIYNIQSLFSRIGYQVDREEKAIFNLHESDPAENIDDFKRIESDLYTVRKKMAEELDGRDKVALFAVIWHNDSNLKPIYIKVDDSNTAGSLGHHLQVHLKLKAA